MQNTATYTTPQMPPTPRLDYIDLAKGICILLVILFHCWDLFETPTVRLIHLPTFFIISGIFFKPSADLKQQIKSKIDKLIVPLIFFGFGADCTLYAFARLHLYEPLHQYPILDLLTGGDLINVPMWFVIAIFIDYILFLAITKVTDNFAIQTIIVLLLANISYRAFTHNIVAGYYILPAFTSMPYIWLGHTITRFLRTHLTHKVTLSEIIIALIIIAVAIAIQYILGTPCIDFLKNWYLGNPIKSFAVSVCYTTALLIICKTIRYIPLISYAGRHSLICLGLHFPIYLIASYYLPPNYTDQAGLIISTITLTTTLILVPVFVRYLPQFVGLKPLIAKQQTTTVPSPT